MFESLPFLAATYVGQPVWLWIAFLAFIAFLLWIDLGVVNNKDGVVSAKKSAAMWASFASMAIAFGAYVYFVYEPDPRYYMSPDNLNQQAVLQYFTGYLLETALAFDNIFVIGMIFTFFAVPRQYQHRVLFWGILGVIVLRAIMIGIGATLVAEFGWVLYLFAGFLILTGIKMLAFGDKEMDLAANPVLKFVRRRFRVTDELHGERFLVKLPDPKTGKLVRYMTPLFLALILIEIADVIFAVDSVPAIFAITTDPYIVYTSNIFAILGLRALYFALAAVLHRFAYLKQALAVLLIFIGSKIFVADLLGLTKFPPAWSLGVTFAILASGIAYSLWRTRNPVPTLTGES